MDNGAQRISINTVVILTIFALVIDLAQILLDAVVIGVVVNRIIDVFVTFGFWLVFRFMGVSFTKTRALIFFGLAFLEMFPGLDAFPLWTIDVVAVCVATMAEDKLGQTTEKLVSNPATRAMLKRGIMKGVNRVAANNPRLQERLNNASGGKWSTNEEKSVGSGKPDANPTRDAKIALQRQQKQSKQNANEQKMAA